MPTPKYKIYFDDMLKLHKALFDSYLDTQKKYDKDKQKYAEELQDIKRQMVRVIKKAEDRLCARTESTKHGNYATGLADKFWEEVRIVFPRIDEIIEV